MRGNRLPPENSATPRLNVKFDMRKVPQSAALTYVGEWLLVVWGCAGGETMSGTDITRTLLHFTSECDTKTRD